jgi:hypothetical protein
MAVYLSMATSRSKPKHSDNSITELDSISRAFGMQVQLTVSHLALNIAPFEPTSNCGHDVIRRMTA